MLDSSGIEVEARPPGTRGLDLLPAESKRLQRKGTVHILPLTHKV
jgi:hypothetical protein